MKINPGQFLHEVSILRRVSVELGTGGQSVSYEKVGTLMCSIRQVSAGENFKYGAEATTVLRKFTTWFTDNPDLVNTSRLDWNGAPHSIVSIENVEEKSEMMVITANAEDPGL